MRLFPSERSRQKSDRRTILFFFEAMAVLTVTITVLISVHRLLGWW